MVLQRRDSSSDGRNRQPAAAQDTIQVSEVNMHPARKFTAAIPWQILLNHFGVSSGAGVLPMISTCPLCSTDSLAIYDDAHTRRVWLSCRHCGFAGDIVDLSGRVWKVDSEEAIRLLMATAPSLRATEVEP